MEATSTNSEFMSVPDPVICNLFLIISTYSGLISTRMAFFPCFFATTPTVPEPAKGSRTVPGLKPALHLHDGSQLATLSFITPVLKQDESETPIASAIFSFFLSVVIFKVFSCFPVVVFSSISKEWLFRFATLNTHFR